MISINTLLEVRDNSGIKLGKCVKIYKKTKSPARIGDLVLISVQKLRKLNKPVKYKKGDLVKGLVLHTRFNSLNEFNVHTLFSINSCVLVNQNFELQTNRLTVPITTTLRNQKRFKLLSISSSIV